MVTDVKQGVRQREWRETAPYRGGLDTGHNMGRYRRRAARVAKIDESGLRRRRRPDPITAVAINNWRNTESTLSLRFIKTRNIDHGEYISRLVTRPGRRALCKVYF